MSETSWTLPDWITERYAALGTFVETGTYEGGAVRQALDAGFRAVHSVESNRAAFNQCTRRFKALETVHLYFGPSVAWLPEILGALDGPALIWLDAHHVEGRWPLRAELGFLSLAPRHGHVIAIDDMDILYGRRRPENWSTGCTPYDIHNQLRRINPDYELHLVDSRERPTSILLAAETCAATPRLARPG